MKKRDKIELMELYMNKENCPAPSHGGNIDDYLFFKDITICKENNKPIIYIMEDSYNILQEDTLEEICEKCEHIKTEKKRYKRDFGYGPDGSLGCDELIDVELCEIYKKRESCPKQKESTDNVRKKILGWFKGEYESYLEDCSEIENPNTWRNIELQGKLNYYKTLIDAIKKQSLEFSRKKDRQKKG